MFKNDFVAWFVGYLTMLYLLHRLFSINERMFMQGKFECESLSPIISSSSLLIKNNLIPFVFSD